MITYSEHEINSIRQKLDSLEDPQEMRQLMFQTLMLEKFILKRKTVSIGTLPIHCEVYESSPDAPVILFIPGIGTYSEMYCEFLCKLSQWGFNVVGVDLRGHGYSGGSRGHYTVQQVISDIHEVVTWVTREYNDRIGLFGSSIGAPLAMACAESDERIRALLCHTLFLTEFPPDIPTALGWNALSFSSAFFPDFKINFKSFIDINLLLKDNVISNFIDYDDRIIWDYPVTTLADIYTRKTRLIHESASFHAAIITGDSDEIISSDYCRFICTKLKHPFDLIVIPDAQHMLPFIHIKDTVLASRDWFRQVLAS